MLKQSVPLTLGSKDEGMHGLRCCKFCRGDIISINRALKAINIIYNYCSTIVRIYNQRTSGSITMPATGLAPTPLHSLVSHPPPSIPPSPPHHLTNPQPLPPPPLPHLPLPPIHPPLRPHRNLRPNPSPPMDPHPPPLPRSKGFNDR